MCKWVSPHSSCFSANAAQGAASAKIAAIQATELSPKMFMRFPCSQVLGGRIILALRPKTPPQNPAGLWPPVQRTFGSALMNAIAVPYFGITFRNSPAASTADKSTHLSFHSTS